MARKKNQTAGESELSRIDVLMRVVKEILEVTDPDSAALARIKAGYLELSREEIPEFFLSLLDEVETSPDDLTPLFKEAAAVKGDPALWRSSLVRLRSGIESPRRRLFSRFISLPGGLKFLLDLRADVLTAQREGTSNLGPLDFDLVRLFETWFQYGFLFLKEVTLESPYSQIEILKNRDMVHPMTSLEEMGQRLGRDRRCFALYHQAMPEEPVVFIEVALTRGIVRSINEIIGGEDEDEGRRDTAVFYSINNTQNGLAGLGLGKMLIFQVVDFLKKAAPEVGTFCTLSPMPGFWRRYLRPILEGRSEGFKMDVKGLSKLFGKQAMALLEREYAARGYGGEPNLAELLMKIFSEPKWAENKALVRSLARPLKRLGYIYLAEEKDLAGRPLDPVANFHLGNGAALSPDNVNFGANWSPMGVDRSLSLMANYVYSRSWLKDFQSSMFRLGGLLPGLARPRG